MAFRIFRFNRARAAFLHDVFMAAVSFGVSLYLRVGDAIVYYAPDLLIRGTITFTIVCAIVFSCTGMYRGMWRYASLNDMMAITKAVTLSIIIFLPIMFLATRLEHLPRSYIFINWFVLVSLLGGPRFLYRVFKDRRLDFVLAREDYRRIPVLLVGAGDEAEMFIREINRNPESNYRAVGIVSEKSARVGRHIHGIKVLGVIDDLPEIVKSLKRVSEAPHRLVITKEHLDGAVVRNLLDKAERLGLTLARLPKLTDLKSGMADRMEVKPIAIEDILGRPQTVLDRPRMKALIEDRRVMVTGAGGTIGGELVRQICDFTPAHITLLDNGEFQLYTIDLEVEERHPELPRSTIICDVRDPGRLDEIMAAEAPELVFHAAALKHVHLVEANPLEGVLTNVIGTRNVAEACRKAGVVMMVQVSTDKAVNPTNVMGASKRLAESYCQSLSLLSEEKHGPTRFVTVRFGNVLGSTGSVVPLFQRQLAEGGPLTVTHPDMARYFMTVREAVELVLQASALGNGDDAGKSLQEGKIFVLDMGEPVRILDLAHQIIRLAGLVPGKDVGIEYIGPRPGEKLVEELFHASEPLVHTECEGILLAAPRTADHAVLARALNELEDAARAGKAAKVLTLLSRLVPDYRPASHRPMESAAKAPSAREAGPPAASLS